MPYARLKVLIAVSSEKLADDLCGYFAEQAVLEMETVMSMYEAVDLMLEHRFNMFVIDGQLLYDQDAFRQRVAGVDFVRFIRLCQGPVAEAPVLFLRSVRERQNLLEANAEIEEAKNAGANAVIAQPFDFTQFDGMLQAVFDTPAEFVRAPAYTGPCRREGQVTVPMERRRKEGIPKLVRAHAGSPEDS